MSAPVFGRRHALSQPRSFDAAARAPDEHAAFFAAVRAELAETQDTRRMVVPRSFKAAFLAGLVVGCALAGFSVTKGASEAAPSPFAAIATALGQPLDSNPIDLTPAKIVLGLLGGARVAALTLIVVHTLMNWIDVTSRTAYAIGGAAVSAAIAAALLIGLDHPPSHGWAIELAAGAGAGFLYRMFAGARVENAR